MNTPRPDTTASPAGHTTLLNKDFLLLWQGQTVSSVGTSLFQIALLYWLLEASGSATVMGLVSMLGALPGIILGPFGGAIADRFSRKTLIVVGDLILGVAMLSLALPFFVLDASVEVKIAWIVTVSMTTGVVSAFFRPAVTAAIPNLVPFSQLQRANAMNSVSMTASMSLGQAAGGVLYRMLGAPWIMVINGVTYLLSALSEMFIHVPQEKPERIRSWRALGRAFIDDIVTGLKYVWGRAGLRNMMLAFALLNVVTAPLSVLMPILLSKFLMLPADWFGYLMAAMGLGNLIGMMLAGIVTVDGRARFVCALSALYVLAISNLIFGLVGNPYLLLCTNLLAGIFLGIMMVTFTTLMQATTPDEIRGRVSSVMMTVMMGSAPLAMGFAGVLADLVNQNIPLLFVCAGILAMVVVTGMALNRPYRDFLSTRLVTMGGSPSMTSNSAVAKTVE
ncbi:MAG: MFS transporter [Pseudomonadota bacterium]